MLTEWKGVPPVRLRHLIKTEDPIIFDGRSLFDPKLPREASISEHRPDSGPHVPGGRKPSFSLCYRVQQNPEG